MARAFSAYADQIRVASALPSGAARLYWRSGAWHRLLPALQGWAALGVPITMGFSGDDIDEIVSATIVRAWTNRTVPEDPAGYVRRIAANLAHDFHKKGGGKSDPNRFQSFEEKHDELLGSETADPGERLDHHQRVMRLYNALRRLNDSLRRVVVLHMLHGRTHEEIAEALGITIGCSKMRLHRGIRLLRGIYHVLPLPPLAGPDIRRRAMGRPPRPMRWRELPQNSGTSAPRPAARASVAARRLLAAL